MAYDIPTYEEDPFNPFMVDVVQRYQQATRQGRTPAFDPTIAPNGQPFLPPEPEAPRDPNQWYTLEDGTQISQDEFDQLAGTGISARKSERLVDGGTRTEKGDVFNAFRGYVSGDGGRFGAGASGDVDTALANLEGLTGVTRDRFGFGADVTAADIDAIRTTMGGIANRDAATIASAKDHSNPFVRQTALAYALGKGSQGLGTMTEAEARAQLARPVASDPTRTPDADRVRQMGYRLDNEGNITNPYTGQAMGTMGSEAAKGLQMLPEFAQARQEAVGAKLRGLVAATHGKAATSGGQGFGAGWTNPYAGVRPLQSAARPVGGMGSPTLNTVSTRPLSGGAY